MKKYGLLAALLGMSVTGYAADWGYQGEKSPENWGRLAPEFALCDTGKNQSPVNIRDALTTSPGPLRLSFRPGKQTIINNGHTVQVSTGDGNTLQLDNDTFTLQQFHFHAPSENTINGRHYPLEAHFVYKNQDNAFAVLALMFSEGDENPQLAHAWQQMPESAGQQAGLTDAVDIRALLPARQDYYRFSGSLTTPPCSEGVRWLVLKQAATVSAAQISRFRAAIPDDNNRPVQPLNGRIIIH